MQVRIFSAPNAGSLVATQSVTLRIDNTAPLVSIDAIEHLREDGTWETIGRCAIVSTPQNQFRFRITARDPEQHLLSWSLGAVWGDNEGATIDHGEYVPAADHHWSGPAGEYRPAGNWAALETRCAHTFRLSAWDRTINGWGYLHYREYTKSITLWLPVP